jgi:hypothetical protein
MSKKPAAALSANLVAVKGTAAPTSDMPGRAAAAVPPTLAVVPTEPLKDAPVPQPAVGQGEAGGQPLNFRVPNTFRREFKVYAAQHGLKLNELLRLSFEAYRRQNGD